MPGFIRSQRWNVLLFAMVLMNTAWLVSSYFQNKRLNDLELQRKSVKETIERQREAQIVPLSSLATTDFPR